MNINWLGYIQTYSLRINRRKISPTIRGKYILYQIISYRIEDQQAQRATENLKIDNFNICIY